MKKNWTLIWITAAMVTAALVTPALADERECFEDCMANGGDQETCWELCRTNDDNDRSDSMTRIATWLELSDEQIAEWLLIRDAAAEAILPLLEQARALREELRAEMRAEDPDRELIGQLTIALEEIREEIHVVKEQALADMIAVLDTDQVERLATAALGQLFRSGNSDDRGGVRDGNGERHGGGGGRP